jgi:uncharacterized protein YjbJ (UPF0337 family)
MTKRAPKTSTEQVKDSVKEAIGKLTGDVRVETEGRRRTDETLPKRGTEPRRD